MAKQYKMKLTEQERSGLLVLTSKGKASARRIKRALVLLRSDEGATDQQIVAGVGVGIATVERIRKRFVEEGLEEALPEKPRPPMTRIRWPHSTTRSQRPRQGGSRSAWSSTTR